MVKSEYLIKGEGNSKEDVEFGDSLKIKINDSSIYAPKEMVGLKKGEFAEIILGWGLYSMFGKVFLSYKTELNIDGKVVYSIDLNEYKEKEFQDTMKVFAERMNKIGNLKYEIKNGQNRKSEPFPDEVMKKLRKNLEDNLKN